MSDILSATDYAGISEKIQTTLKPIANLLDEVPLRRVPEDWDSFDTYKVELKSTPKKASKNSEPEQGDFEFTKENTPLKTFDTPMIRVSESMVSAMKRKGLKAADAINVAVTYSLNSFENSKVAEILATTTANTNSIDLKVATALHERLNSIQDVTYAMMNEKVPLTNLKLLLNPAAMARLNFNEYMKAGTAVLENDLKIKVVPCSEIGQTTGYLIESNPLVVDFAAAMLQKTHKVLPKTSPQDYEEFFLRDKLGGFLCYPAGVQKLTVTLA